MSHWLLQARSALLHDNASSLDAARKLAVVNGLGEHSRAQVRLSGLLRLSTTPACRCSVDATLISTLAVTRQPHSSKPVELDREAPWLRLVVACRDIQQPSRKLWGQVYWAAKPLSG